MGRYGSVSRSKYILEDMVQYLGVKVRVLRVSLMYGCVFLIGSKLQFKV